jgi:hypothetical protein
VISVESDVEQKTEFVDVAYKGQIVKVYMRDIQKSAERVQHQIG